MRRQLVGDVLHAQGRLHHTLSPSHLIERDEVDVAHHSSTEVDECIDVLVIVVDVLDERVLESGASLRGVAIALQRVPQLLERDALHLGHELVARFLNGGMKRDCKRVLLGLFPKASHAIDKATCRDGDVPSSDSEAVCGVHAPKRLDDGVVVEKRLSLTHANHIGDALAEVIHHEPDLIEHLPACEVP